MTSKVSLLAWKEYNAKDFATLQTNIKMHIAWLLEWKSEHTASIVDDSVSKFEMLLDDVDANFKVDRIGMTSNSMWTLVVSWEVADILVWDQNFTLPLSWFLEN